MQPSAPMDHEITQHYATAIDALCETAAAAYTLGRWGHALSLLRTTLQLLETHEATPWHRLKVLHLYGRVLVLDHFLAHEGADEMFAIIRSAKHLAEAIHDHQAVADALSLLGQAFYFAAVVESQQRGTFLSAVPGPGNYAQALAYQQQALELRKALPDTRGISESYFQIGAVYERWQEHERSRDYYRKALEFADQGGHQREKTEPTRHLAIHALREGNLDRALTLALQALSLREAVRFKPFLPLDHLLVRDVYLAKGDTTNAEFHTQQAAALAEEMGLQRLVASMPNIRDVLGDQRAGA